MLHLHELQGLCHVCVVERGREFVGKLAHSLLRLHLLHSDHHHQVDSPFESRALDGTEKRNWDNPMPFLRLCHVLVDDGIRGSLSAQFSVMSRLELDGMANFGSNMS